MKASLKLKIKSTKLKQLSKEDVQKIGAAGKTVEPPQQQGAYWPTLVTCNC